MYDITNRARLIFRDFYYGANSLRRKAISSGDFPILLCNSFPKSGTHLLSQILQRFKGAALWNDIIAVQSLSGVMNSENHLRWKFGCAPSGSIVRAHLAYGPEILAILSKRPTRRFMIYRDLRDVAVSHANWVLKEPRFYLHKIYKSLPNFEACLMASIVGIPQGTPFSSNLSHPDIGTDFSRWSGWLNDPDTLTIRFEDLVGARGGGSETKRLEIVEMIAKSLGDDRSMKSLAIEFASDAMNPEASHTFRKGNNGLIGSWRDRFTDEHKDAFKRCAGSTLIQLGYENDNSW